ncbi:hypothetical protein [Methylobacter sp. YRD-M1]|jgi:hypothetical protein|uniref:hypothetical protein n=1 Tax=Methylobacter sp. YRD-M1 TaxID=2911520 RepID=UPI00227B5468|nr:hypothetical protein [Methylobacter sp. YRD-M1]WAK04310.1 hypothetical protein LZ558_21820 [Methylobacter sp. YRD-M1]
MSEKKRFTALISSTNKVINGLSNFGLDFSAKTYSIFVDGASLGTFGFKSNVNTDILMRGSLVINAVPGTTILLKGDM